MGHAEVENYTPFAFHGQFASDEDGRPVFVPIVKATFIIESDGSLTLADKQIPVTSTGQFYGGPSVSSYKYEPETAFFKPATDVVLVGSAWARPAPATEIDVSLRAGPLFKRARVFGDRYWMKSLVGPAITSPEPFESLPLIYERAFGGRDASGRLEPRNPIGKGFCSSRSLLDDGAPLPNLEDPAKLIASLNDRPAPVGFGFVSPGWQPRAGFAGTYDDSWTADRMPLLPKDFKRRFFNAASAGLIAPGYFEGDEFISVDNASPRGTVSFSLPGIPPPKHRVQLASGLDAFVRTSLDTVIINTDEDLVILIWRGYLSITNGLHDIISIQIRTEGVSAPAAVR
jgi:hypothetical protein